MAAGPAQLQSGEQVAQGQGPNASLEFGDVSRLQQLANSLKNNAPGAYAAAQPPAPGAPPSASPSPGAPPGGATQPGVNAGYLRLAREIMTPQLAAQIVRPPQPAPLPYPVGLMVEASKPGAGPHLKALARIASRGFGRTPQP